MTNTIEHEIRGKLTEAQYSSLLKFLQNKGHHKHNYKRLIIKFNPQEFYKSEQDLRLKIQENKAEIVLKVGKQSDSKRIEIPVRIEKEDFANALDLFAQLGNTQLLAFWRYAEVFTYKNVEIALVKAPNYATSYFEIEMLTTENYGESILTDMQKIVDELQLQPFMTESEYHDYIEELGRHANIYFNYGERSMEQLMNPQDPMWSK